MSRCRLQQWCLAQPFDLLINPYEPFEYYKFLAEVSVSFKNLLTPLSHSSLTLKKFGGSGGSNNNDDSIHVCLGFHYLTQQQQLWSIFSS
jgi:hypothetical protein